MQNYFKRQIVLDTETTGLNITNNINTTHRIIEIGAVEIINREITKNFFHVYINPGRPIDKGAFKIHNISDNFLLNKPKFLEIVHSFINYVNKSELIIHNASFDIRFINNELNIVKFPVLAIEKYCHIIDTLSIARKLYPGKKNTLDKLCKRLDIKNCERKLHNAILDAKLLAKVYLRMTRTQDKLVFSNKVDYLSKKINFVNNIKKLNKTLLLANTKELSAHEQYLDLMYRNNKKCIWKKLK
ncbi:DNA polymerase III subunit epsilon [Buchnera aphidicola (Nipponaphis monzeni)]|uniref:DNA polymerase III subunit epsilon n=1 Tax=Buchnera aphidicola (Nipponaphis monzeni) TaxID=2495405 RepID=A0A455TA54_9GAMM|nr:DNA polymerase III subunit epsilon [Buchnera aphidicola]BBI01209.1 DNA polymerase III subunit epsilon [Buchnera aphidicola (Nipponaphis monzeni)]